MEEAMHTRSIFIMTLFLILLGESSIAATSDSPATTIALDKFVHFVAPNGDDVEVSPGVYGIDVTEEWLRLNRGEARDTLLLQAQHSRHEESVAEPIALSIPSDQDLHHIVVLLPSGESLVAIGNYSGIQSRAPVQLTVNPTTINKALLAKQQTLSTTKPSSQPASTPPAGAQVQVAGAPPPPTLVTPTAGQIFSEPTGISFAWQPGPSGVSYEVLVWKAGSNQAQDRTNRQHAVVLGQISSKTLHNNSLSNRTLSDDFLGKQVRWTVKACASVTSQFSSALGGTSQNRCSEAEPSTFTIQFVAPRLINPTGGRVNPRLYPSLKTEGYSSRTERLLFCLAKPGHSCGTTPTSISDPSVYVLPIRPPFFPVSTFVAQGNLTQFVGQTVHWTAAACHATVGCVWAEPKQITIVPDPPIPTLLGPESVRWTESPVHSFAWSIPPDQANNVTHYKFCFLVIGPSFADCEETSPPPNKFVKGLARTSLRLNLRTESPGGLPEYLNAWTVGACNDIGCAYSGTGKGIYVLPLPKQSQLQTPPSWVLRQSPTIQLTWSTSRHATFYVPCLRDVNKTCENGNEIFDARIQRPSYEVYESVASYRCELRGTYPSGVSVQKHWQVGACNPVWGCTWSTPAVVTFAVPAFRESRAPQPLTCPRVNVP
jgi:hypothetical protein